MRIRNKIDHIRNNVTIASYYSPNGVAANSAESAVDTALQTPPLNVLAGDKIRLSTWCEFDGVTGVPINNGENEKYTQVLIAVVG